MYKITKADLIGKISDFPIDVVEKMIERQVEQGEKADVKVFQHSRTANASGGGFSWKDSIEGWEFWAEVIMKQNFDVFFAKYPMRSHLVYILQDGTKKGMDVIDTLINRGGINRWSHDGNELDALYYIEPNSNIIRWVEKFDVFMRPLLETFYTEIDVEPQIKEYSLQEIADKLGINVELLRIKK